MIKKLTKIDWAISGMSISYIYYSPIASWHNHDSIVYKKLRKLFPNLQRNWYKKESAQILKRLRITGLGNLQSIDVAECLQIEQDSTKPQGFSPQLFQYYSNREITWPPFRKIKLNRSLLEPKFWPKRRNMSYKSAGC